MKKIINNKVYNSDTAKLIGARRCDDPGMSAYGFKEEKLYQKKTGEFFLLGVGGPDGKYATRNRRGWTAESARIVPVQYDEARDWAEAVLPPEEYAQHFGELAIDENRTEWMTISVPASIAHRIRIEAQRTGSTISGTIAQKFA